MKKMTISVTYLITHLRYKVESESKEQEVSRQEA